MDDHRIADRYEPIEVLGRGGEATVVKAVDTRHDRLVAVEDPSGSPGREPEALFVEARALFRCRRTPGSRTRATTCSIEAATSSSSTGSKE